MPGDDRRQQPSLDAVLAKFEGFERLVEQRFDSLDDRLDRMDFVHLPAYISDLHAIEGRLNRIEADAQRRDERMSRLAWAVFSSLAAPVVVGVILYLLIGSH